MILQWLASSEWANVVRALLHTLWQGTVIAVLLGMVLRRLTRPEMRYRCSLAALAGLLLAGLVTWAVLNRPMAAAAPAPLSPARPAGVTPQAPATVLVVNFPLAEQPPAGPGWTAWLALFWILGATMMIGRAGAQVAGAERLRRSSHPPSGDRFTVLLAETRRAVGLARQVRLAVTDRLTSPAVVGVLVPTLILPLSLTTTLTPEQIRFVLLHELAHIRRGDYFANLFQLFVEALLFFNPVVWWISRQVRLEREACCDALAIELSGAPADYARTLVHVAENVLNPAAAAAPAFGDRREPSSLADRVQRLMVPGYRPHLRLTWRAMLAALFVGGALLTLSAIGTRAGVSVAPDFRLVKLALENRHDAGPLEEPEQQTTSGRGVNRASLFPATSAETVPVSSNLMTRIFKIDRPMDVNRVRKILLEAGVKMPPTVFFYQDNGILLVRGPREQVALVNRVVLKLNGFSPKKIEAADKLFGDSTVIGGLDGQGATNLETRTFRIDPNIFYRSLQDAALQFLGPANSSAGAARNGSGLLMVTAATPAADISLAARQFFTNLGLDLDPPKAVFFNDRLDLLFVHATAQDLDVIERAVQALTYAQPQIHIKARFIEVPLNVAEGLKTFLAWTNAADGQWTGILTRANADDFLKEIRRRSNVNELAEPEVTTLSGRQTQMRAVHSFTVVTNFVLKEFSDSPDTAVVPQTTELAIGPVIDVVPCLLTDECTVDLTTIAAQNEFLGYDAATNQNFAVSAAGLKVPIPTVLPKIRLRQAMTHVRLWDNQTLVLGGIQPEILKHQNQPSSAGSATDQPWFNQATPEEATAATRNRQLLVLVTVSLVDPAGNLFHSDDEMAFAQKGVPRQPDNP